MKVIEAISDTNIGGAGRLLLTRLACSDRDRIESTVLLPRGSALEERFASEGIRVIAFDGGADKSFDIAAVRSISKILANEEPDLVNAHGCLSARVAAMLCRVPVRLFTRHCAYEVPNILRRFPIKQVIGAASGLLSDGIIAVADAAEQNLVDLGIKEKKVRVIINGVEGLRKYSFEEREAARRELGVDGKKVVGICARIEDCKDHKSFLRAARILSIKDDSYRFLIVGEGSRRAECEALSEALGLSGKVIFTGFCNDVERYFNCMDINVNCSIGTETSSLALSEGMSIGLPAVVSDYGGNPYMVRDGENGFVYHCGDFVVLARLIDDLARDSELYARMSHNAYERYLRELNSKNMTEQTEKYYFELYNKYIG